MSMQESLEKIRQSLPNKRKDGMPRRIQMSRREEGLAEIVEALLNHIALRDGNAEISTAVCRGCNHDRLHNPCPVVDIVEILKDMGRESPYAVF